MPLQEFYCSCCHKYAYTAIRNQAFLDQPFLLVSLHFVVNFSTYHFVPQVELIQEQWGMKGLLTILERLGIKRPLPFLKRWQRRQQTIRCKTEYRADDCSSQSSTHSSTNPRHSTRSSKHYFRFVLTLLGSGYRKYVLGRDYAHHAKIAKELKERNEDIYNTVMVGIRQYLAVNI